MLSFFVVLAAVSFGAATQTRTLTVKNQCKFDIWPAIYTDPTSPARPEVSNGWHAPAGSSRSFKVPHDWKSGRIWGRTDCDADGNCSSGSCPGGVICDPKATGATPVSLAEWTLNAAGGLDFYDVSLVDGYNLPMSITNDVGCNVADCNADLNNDCPKELQLKDAAGNVVGCKSACGANGDTSNSKDCCTGQYNTADTCPSNGVKFYSFFKSSCPNSYVFAYDEPSGTALWSCPASKAADYTLIFCPSGNDGGIGVLGNHKRESANETSTDVEIPRYHRASAAALRKHSD